MRSIIHATEILPNRDRRFGAASVYFPATLRRADGSEVPLLFTDHELTSAKHRAEGNPEDVDAARRAGRSVRWAGLALVALLGGSALLVLVIAGGVIRWAAH